VRERRYVLYFNESMRGLSVGAPVTLWGLTVGRVTNVDLTYDPATLRIRPRVMITFSPARLLAHVSQQEQAAVKALLGMSEEKRTEVVRRMVEVQGLRARLQTGNLLSGELYVALEYHPNAPKVHIDWSADPLELPVASGGLASIEDKLDSILTKVDQMPLDAMGTQVKDALVKLNTTLKDANVLIERIDTQLVPAATETLQQLHVAIANGDQALFGKESAGPQDLRDTLVEVAGAARAVRVLVDYLQRHPEALIRGKKEEEKP
jgi:paraquat-inducible protein B